MIKGKFLDIKFFFKKDTARRHSCDCVWHKRMNHKIFSENKGVPRRKPPFNAQKQEKDAYFIWKIVKLKIYIFHVCTKYWSFIESGTPWRWTEKLWQIFSLSKIVSYLQNFSSISSFLRQGQAIEVYFSHSVIEARIQRVGPSREYWDTFSGFFVWKNHEQI